MPRPPMAGKPHRPKPPSSPAPAEPPVSDADLREVFARGATHGRAEMATAINRALDGQEPRRFTGPDAVGLNAVVDAVGNVIATASQLGKTIEDMGKEPPRGRGGR
jgi:hypothetical protein